MKKSHHMLLTLILVGILSSGALVGVYKYTKPLIQQNQQEALRKAIFQVLPEIESFETVVKDEMKIYKGFSASGELVGYAFVGEGPGYQGTIRIMIGVGPRIEQTLGIQILESVETPGLGQKINSSFFRDQFHQLDVTPSIELVKKEPTESNEVEAITGATISSQSVVDIVNRTVGKVQRLLATAQ